MGIRGNVSLATLADANGRPDSRIYAEFSKSLIGAARRLYADDDLGLYLDGTVYGLDSKTISLRLAWLLQAGYRETNEVKIPRCSIPDCRGAIPAFILVLDGLLHDVKIIDLFRPAPSAFYVMDCACIDFRRLFTINQGGVFFVTRPKKTKKFKRCSS